MEGREFQAAQILLQTGSMSWLLGNTEHQQQPPTASPARRRGESALHCALLEEEQAARGLWASGARGRAGGKGAKGQRVAVEGEGCAGLAGGELLFPSARLLAFRRRLECGV